VLRIRDVFVTDQGSGSKNFFIPGPEFFSIASYGFRSKSSINSKFHKDNLARILKISKENLTKNISDLGSRKIHPGSKHQIPDPDSKHCCHINIYIILLVFHDISQRIAETTSFSFPEPEHLLLPEL
jgi:hypothetical protein